MDLDKIIKQILGPTIQDPDEVHREFARDYAPMFYRIAANFPGGRCVFDTQEELEQNLLRRISHLKPERVNAWARDYLIPFMVYVALDDLVQIDTPDISFRDLFITALEASGEANNDLLAESDWNQNIMMCTAAIPEKSHSQLQLNDALLRISAALHDAVLRAFTPEQKAYYDRALLEMANEVDGLSLDVS